MGLAVSGTVQRPQQRPSDAHHSNEAIAESPRPYRFMMAGKHLKMKFINAIIT